MAIANFNNLFDSDYIKELVNRNSNKLVDELYYHLTDNDISFSYDKLYDMVYDYVASLVKKDLSTFYENTTDKYNNMFKLLSDNLEYVRSNGTFEGKNVDESAMYAKDLIEQVDINMEQFNGEHQYYDMDNYYDELSNKIKNLLAIYNKEDCYQEMKQVIEKAKDKNNSDCSLEYSDSSIKSFKAIQEINYEILSSINTAKKEKEEDKEVKNENESIDKKLRLEKRFMDNLAKFENKSGQSSISYGDNGDIISDYINSNTVISCPFMTDTICRFKLDDPEIYVDFINFFNSKERGVKYNTYDCIQEFLDGVFGKWGDFVNRDNIYQNHNNNDEIASIKDFYGNNSAGPIERAALAHNCMKLLGVNDYLVLGGIRKDNDKTFTPYAYNVVQNVKGAFMLYDSFDPVKLEDGNTVARGSVISDLNDIANFSSFSLNFSSFVHNVSKIENHKNEYISPNYYKNMNNNLSSKADEMIRQMEQGIDVLGTGEYNNQNTNGRQKGYTMIGIVCLLSIISSIGIIILGVMLR